MEFEVKVKKLTHDDLVTILADALSGCYHLSAEYDTEFYNSIPEDKKEGDCFEDKLADCLLNGGKIVFVDNESDGEVYKTNNVKSYTNDECLGTYEVTYEDFLVGCSNGEGFSLAKELLIDEQGDYYTANGLLQIVVFGEVIYG